MKNIEKQLAVIDRLVQWGEKQDFMCAMLLFSSRANPEAAVDVFSDYDILMAVTDVRLKPLSRTAFPPSSNDTICAAPARQPRYRAGKEI